MSPARSCLLYTSEGIQLRPEQEDTLFGNYLNAVHYTDAAIGTFLSQLKQEGLYDNSIIVFYGDHFGLKATDEENQEQMSAFLGHTYDYDEMFNIPLIVHIPGSGVSETISTAGGQIDFMPTIVDLKMCIRDRCAPARAARPFSPAFPATGSSRRRSP